MKNCGIRTTALRLAAPFHYIHPLHSQQTFTIVLITILITDKRKSGAVLEALLQKNLVSNTAPLKSNKVRHHGIHTFPKLV